MGGGAHKFLRRFTTILEFKGTKHTNMNVHDDGRTDCACQLCLMVLILEMKVKDDASLSLCSFTTTEAETATTCSSFHVSVVEDIVLRPHFRQMYEYDADYWVNRLG